MSKAFQQFVVSGRPIPPKVQQDFFNVDPDPETRAVLSAALDAKLLEPDDVLVAYVSKAMTDNQLWAISIALRNGANPNMYVQSDIVKGPVHLLVYVNVVWRDPKRHPPAISNDRLMLLSLVLLALGADPNLPAIDPKAGAVQASSSRTLSKSPSVMTWLDTNNFVHRLRDAWPDIRPVVTKATLKKVAILSGRLGLLEGIELDAKDDALLILKSRANDVRYAGKLAYKAYKLPSASASGRWSPPSSPLPSREEDEVATRVAASAAVGTSSRPYSGAASDHNLDLRPEDPHIPLSSIPVEFEDDRPREPMEGVATDTEEDDGQTFDILTLLPPPTAMHGLDYDILWNGVLYANQGVVAFYAARGLFVSYPLLNIIILKARQYETQQQPVLMNVYLSMLASSIQAGISIDADQRTLMAGLPAEMYRSLSDTYARPYWEKECAHPNLFNDRISNRLKMIVEEIGLEPQDHASVCYQLDSLSKVGNDELKSSARTRQQARLSAEHGYFSEFTGDRGPALVCDNADDFDGDPFDTADLNWGHYRDIRGTVWCYTSPQFEELAGAKVNPVTNEPLPDSFLAQMRYKQDRLRQLGRDPKVSRKFSELIDEVTKPDKFGGMESGQQLEQFEDYAAGFELTKKDLATVTAAQLGEVTDKNGYPTELSRLANGHALVTFAYIINGLRVKDPTRARTMLNGLRLKVKGSLPLVPGPAMPIRMSPPPPPSYSRAPFRSF